MLLSILIVAACQGTAPQKESHYILEAGHEPDPAYNELTRQETKETLERLKKIREEQQTLHGRYTGPIRHAWDRILAGRQIEYEDNLRIEKQATYLLRDREYITRVSKRAEPFIHFILDEIDKRNLPAELALLPVIESAYRPTAVSRSNAVGLWQFILPTSRHLGMEKTWWYDARRDVVESTRYALDYLQMLNKKFDGDWFLALAAYNGGHGNISRAIERNRRRGKPTDFWNLKLKTETRNYVPRFLAATQIYTRPEAYNVELHPVSNRPYFTSVKYNRPVDINKIARLAAMDTADFKNLNAGFLRWATPPKGSYRLLVPLDKQARFRRQLASLPTSKQHKWYKHTVKVGDTLTGIALQYGVLINTLKEANQLDSTLIRAGSELLIPLGKTKHSPAKQPSSHRVATTSVATHEFYTVQPGDTLWGIAKLHRLSVDRLLILNKLEITSVIKPGQRLRVRTQSKKLAANMPAQLAP